MANAARSPTTSRLGGGASGTLVADSLTGAANGQPSSGYFSNNSIDPDNDTQPRFKGDVDRWICPLCGKVLRNAVQTPCGHRYCEKCLEKYIPADGKAVRCPADEEDCEMVSKVEHPFHKDASARREVGNLLVYCLYHVYGCLAQLRWKDLPRHVETCPEKRVFCPNKDHGCPSAIKPDELDHHVQRCEFKPKPCQYCQQVNTHNSGCPLKEAQCTFTQFGCNFQGVVSALEKHHKTFMPQHLEMLTVYVAHMDIENTSLRCQLQGNARDKEVVTARLEEVLTENKTLKESHKNIQRNLAKHDDRLTRLDGQVSKFDTDLSNHRRDLSLIQNSDLLDRADVGAEHRPVSETVDQLERQLGIFNLRMVEMDLRFQLLEASSYNGTLLWKITNYAKRKSDAVAGKTLSLYSQPFYTNRHGYKMCGRVYLNGDGMGKTTHVSLFFTVMKGDYDALLDWPFRQKVTFMILDQEAGRNHLVDSFRPDPNSSSFKRPTSEMNIASGCPLFALQADVEGAGSRFIKDDTIFIKVVVETANIRHP